MIAPRPGCLPRNIIHRDTPSARGRRHPEIHISRSGFTFETVVIKQAQVRQTLLWPFTCHIARGELQQGNFFLAACIRIRAPTADEVRPMAMLADELRRTSWCRAQKRRKIWSTSPGSLSKTSAPHRHVVVELIGSCSDLVCSQRCPTSKILPYPLRLLPSNSLQYTLSYPIMVLSPEVYRVCLDQRGFHDVQTTC